MSVVSFFSLKIHKTTRVLHTHTNSALQNRRHLPSTNVGRRDKCAEGGVLTGWGDEEGQYQRRRKKGKKSWPRACVVSTIFT
jgi:hypothetical protein